MRNGFCLRRRHSSSDTNPSEPTPIVFRFVLFFSDDSDSESVFVMLNGEESELIFTYCSNIKVFQLKLKIEIEMTNG